jgi:hypothetical protein
LLGYNRIRLTALNLSSLVIYIYSANNTDFASASAERIRDTGLVDGRMKEFRKLNKAKEGESEWWSRLAFELFSFCKNIIAFTFPVFVFTLYPHLYILLFLHDVVVVVIELNSNRISADWLRGGGKRGGIYLA